MPIDRGAIFLDICAEMAGELRAKIAATEKRIEEIDLEVIVLERLRAGESPTDILKTGNDAVILAVRRIINSLSGRLKPSLEEA